MKTRTSFLLLALSVAIRAQNTAVTPLTAEANLPSQKIGVDDLVSVSVYDRPELTRTLRVSGEGTIQMPLLAEPIPAKGLLPSELEGAIADRLTQQEILIRPVVSVAVVEYRSRPVSVVGAVKHPLTFQVSGKIQLLDALARAEGLAPEAGSEILVTATSEGGAHITRRIPTKHLIDLADPESNMVLVGGEEIRVPEAGKVFVAGNVRKPGVLSLRDGEALSVLKVLALSEGLMPFAAKEAYVYRREASGQRNEVRIPLAKIVERKSPDVPLEDQDILYVPDNKGRRTAMTTIDRVLSFGSAAGAAAIYGTTR